MFVLFGADDGLPAGFTHNGTRDLIRGLFLARLHIDPSRPQRRVTHRCYSTITCTAVFSEKKILGLGEKGTSRF